MKLAKVLVFLTVFFLLLVFRLSYLVSPASAVPAVPAPGRIPCPAPADANPEFSSDRPYQGSPCGDRPITFWCGNTVVMNMGTVSVPYCDEANGGATSCPANIHKDQKIDVDLTDVELPILGNTQLTKNSTSQVDQIDDGQKVSDYLSWYLNGTNDKAEYPVTDPNTPEGHSKIVDTSGPLKKLLPGVIQDAQRIVTIFTPTTPIVPYVDDETNQTVDTETQNHNQIVVCAKKDYTWGFIGWLLDRVEKAVPQPCYEGGGAASGEYRLNDWNDGNLSSVNTFFNTWLGTEAWDKKYPPLPWQFSKDIYYQKAYNEWRGKTCAIVPLVNLLLCGDIPIISPNREWADLFPYVPLANTIDKKGSHWVTVAHISAPRATIENYTKEILHFPQLYLSHSLENFDLSALLKKTYKATGDESVISAPIPGDVETNSSCKIIPSRSNPGDDATFDDPKSHIEIDTHYDVTEIKCTPAVYNPTTGLYHAKCESDVYVTIPSVSKTPYAEEIWRNTVAGEDSIFRRIFPKTGVNSPVSCIADTPAVSNATYTVNRNTSARGILIDRVIEPDESAVRGEGGTSGSESVDAQLYYPHYGGVLDYFLNGIQTALRPKGYGTPLTSGTACINSDSGDCSWNMSKINQGISQAAAKYNVPESLLRAIFEIESYEWINGAEQYQCKPRGDSGAMGVAQITQETYDDVTCGSEKMNDVGMCSEYDPKLSRCSFTDAFELMARVLLYKAGRWNTTSCTQASGIQESETQVWYDASCDYYGSHDPDDLTINLSTDIPEASRRPNGQAMNYCDIVGYKMGAFPPYPTQP